MNKKAQVAPFMTLLIVIIILAIGATALMGELVYHKLRLANALDSALISAGTDLARSLNLVRQTHFRMFLNHWRLQVMLAARGVWTSKGEAIAFAVGYVEGIRTGRRMFESARQVVKDTPKNIRINLYDRVFAAMVDEPKYFKYKKNEETGEYELDYDAYLDTDTGFSAKYLDFKNNHKDEPDAWYLRKQLSYSWDKTPAPVCEKREEGKCIRYKCVKDDQGNCLRYETAITEGWLSEGRPAKERDGEKFDSYLEMKLANAPQKISIRAQKLPLFFLWRCGHSVCPGILPNPYAGISRIVVSPSKSFGATVRKMPFRIFPYFISERKPDETEEDEEKRKEISHKSKIRIAGSLMSGFEVRLVE